MCKSQSIELVRSRQAAQSSSCLSSATEAPAAQSLACLKLALLVLLLSSASPRAHERSRSAEASARFHCPEATLRALCTHSGTFPAFLRSWLKAGDQPFGAGAAGLAPPPLQRWA